MRSIRCCGPRRGVEVGRILGVGRHTVTQLPRPGARLALRSVEEAKRLPRRWKFGDQEERGGGRGRTGHLEGVVGHRVADTVDHDENLLPRLCVEADLLGSGVSGVRRGEAQVGLALVGPQDDEIQVGAQVLEAKLVVAVDLPYLDIGAIQFLIDSRNPVKVATAFRNPVDQKPDPLLAIWEPRSYPLLKEALATDRLSPRDLLIHSDTTLLDPLNKQAIKSIDTIEEYQEALRYFENES